MENTINWNRIILPERYSKLADTLIREKLCYQDPFIVTNTIIKKGKASFLPFHFLTVEKYMEKWMNRKMVNFPFNDSWRNVSISSMGGIERTMINLEIVLANKSDVILYLVAESIGGVEKVYKRIIAENSYKPNIVEISIVESASYTVIPNVEKFISIAPFGLD